MRRLALGGLVLMVVLGLAVGGALSGEQTKTQAKTQHQEQAEPQNCYCYSLCDSEDSPSPGCDCPQECQQNQSGECIGDPPEDPWEWEYQLQNGYLFRWLFGDD